MAGDNKQKYPFTWAELQHARKYPTKDLYAKILLYKDSKRVVIIKSSKDEKKFLVSLE